MIQGLNHITLAVSDLERSLFFYIEILGFQGHVCWEQGAYLSAGSLWLCLSWDKPATRTDYTHIAFDIEEQNFASYCRQLRAKGVKEWKENLSEGESIYILDPDGHKLEIHSGSLNSRLQSLRINPYQGLRWL